MAKVGFVVAGLWILFANSVFGADPAPLANVLPAINPFTPPAASLFAVENRDVWELKGIMLAGPASQVDLDGRVIGIGETIRGFTLIAIEPRRVVLHRDGVTEVVSLDDNVEAREGG